MAIANRSGSYLQRAPRPSGLADVLDVILDKGIVIDAFVRVSLIGIEVLTVDARIAIASVDTYLRFAEAVNRLDLRESGGENIPKALPKIEQAMAKKVTEHKIEQAKDTIEDKVVPDSPNVRGAMKGVAAGAAAAGAAVAAKAIADRLRRDDDTDADEPGADDSGERADE